MIVSVHLFGYLEDFRKPGNPIYPEQTTAMATVTAGHAQSLLQSQRGTRTFRLHSAVSQVLSPASFFQTGRRERGSQSREGL